METHLKTTRISLVLIALSLIAIGFIFIYCASYVYALERFGSPSYFVKKQALGLLLGLIAFGSARFIPMSLLYRSTPLLTLAAIAISAMALLPGFGVVIHGSHRWLSLKLVTFQPSDLLKIGIVLYTAYFLSQPDRVHRWFIIKCMPLLAVLGVTSGILLFQPDFGLMITLLATTIIMLLIAQYHVRSILISIAMFVPVGLLLIVLKPYRLARIMTFLNPWKDPQGAGFQIIQSLIAIGAGGIKGLGIAHSKQKFYYLPMQHTDFIFSIIAEETGVLGTAVVIALFLALLYCGIKLALAAPDRYCFFVCIGLVVVMSLQTIINLAVVSGLAPTKGLGLPFISYGNSALITYMAMIGLVLNASSNQQAYSVASLHVTPTPL